MIPEIATSVFYLEKGQVSEIIESSIGYHIVKIEDKKNEDGVDLVNLRQIFVRTESFSDWLMNTEKEYGIYVLKNEFHWNKNKSEVIFRNTEMIKYENNLFEIEMNDPSLIF